MSDKEVKAAEAKAHRSGFVSLVGRPNAGKSTLLNRLVGEKLAIVSDKPQTTRTAVQGVLTRPDAQIVFLDTPGIHNAGTALNRRMMDSVHGALEGRDVIVFLADCTARMGTEDAHAVLLAAGSGKPAILALNKIDRLDDKRLLLPLIESYQKLHEFAACVPLSAQTGEGVEELLGTIIGLLPEGPAYYPEDYLTDQPERFLAAELIREQILAATRQEVPHAVGVAIEQWEERNAKLVHIAAVVCVERQGQKAIIVGGKGAVLKRVASMARQQIEAMLDRKVFLEIFVKVEEGWRNKPGLLEVVDWRAGSLPRAERGLDPEDGFQSESK